MRYLLLVVLLSSGVVQLSAQVTNIDTVDYPNPVIPKSNTYHFNTDYWYTIAVRAYAYEQFPQLLNQPSGQPYHPSYLNGLLFKINDNQISYRLQAAHFRNDIAFDNECEGCLPQVSGKLRNTAIKVGVEKSVNYSRVQPYFGGDLGFMFQQFNTRGFDNTTVFAEDTKNALLFSPFVGAKVYVIPRIAVGVEANFNIAYTYQKVNHYADDSFSGAPNQVRRYRWEYFFAPVAAITLQYSFGLINQ
ncbi:MAG TPA: hypothetical protein VNQ80_12985 [Parapedobacter sp.]|uniref:hypothetical protein n=1 Tax=Parapedobacter sp. TaxID=1958893 RepID=UPI002C26172A|nr:hypothetical protein [Parapedobacter sp.]HWK58253.1 hypothetical protein [Parapedobacter sp.]